MKTVYSLVLDDGVVAEVDRAAYLSGTNRSTLINRILAEYFSCETPEEKIRSAFARISALLDGQDSFRLMMPPSRTLLSLQSGLLYKYNPTAKYSVELYPADPAYIGELRVSFRTQNRALLDAAMDFYALFDLAEEHLLPLHEADAEGGRYTRKLLRPKQGVGEPLGELIADYIRLFDGAMKLYFSQNGNSGKVLPEVEKAYQSYLNRHETVF